MLTGSLCGQAVLSEEELVGVEQASATAAEVTGSMMRIKLELEEKKRTVNMLQTALVRRCTHIRELFNFPISCRRYLKLRCVYLLYLLFHQAQQRELTVRHVKETEKELNRNFQLQKEQYEATIQRHLAFIDQVDTHNLIPAVNHLQDIKILLPFFPCSLKCDLSSVS